MNGAPRVLQRAEVWLQILRLFGLGAQESGCSALRSEMTPQKLYLLKSVGGLNCHDVIKYLAVNHSCPVICTFAAGQQEHPWN